MAKRPRTPKLMSKVPAAVQNLFKSFPVAAGEDASEYQTLLQAVAEAVEPNDIIEAIFAKDITDNSWEVQRLRRIESALLEDGRAAPRSTISSERNARLQESLTWFRTPVEVHLQRPRDEQERARLDQEFRASHPGKYAEHLRRQEEVTEKYGGMLGSKKAQEKEVTPAESIAAVAEAFKRNSREIDLVSRLIAVAEVRRNAAVRELERYRAARASRTPKQDIMDAEYTEASPPLANKRP